MQYPCQNPLNCEEPGIGRGSKDSCGNENHGKKISMGEKKATSILFSMKIKMIDL